MIDNFTIVYGDFTSDRTSGKGVKMYLLQERVWPLSGGENWITWRVQWLDSHGRRNMRTFDQWREVEVFCLLMFEPEIDLLKIAHARKRPEQGRSLGGRTAIHATQ